MAELEFQGRKGTPEYRDAVGQVQNLEFHGARPMAAPPQLGYGLHPTGAPGLPGQSSYFGAAGIGSAGRTQQALGNPALNVGQSTQPGMMAHIAFGSPSAALSAYHGIMGRGGF